jgi:ADP-ribosylglycohydrolase
MSNSKEQVRAGIYGVIVGDMLGVPVEFMRREVLQENPVTGPREGGSHEQPLGAWSDDSSLTLALADGLQDPLELKIIAQNFVDWWQKKKYTSHDRLFDIGQRTLLAFNELFKILESEDYESLEYLHHEASVNTNGNGSLMRTLPLYFYLKDKGIEDNFKIIWQISALTHPHIRSALACLIYLIVLDEMQPGVLLTEVYQKTQVRTKDFFTANKIAEEEQEVFSRILEGDISTLKESDIKSDGYVIHTLEASLWSLLNTGSYEEAVLRAVNLGHDTDTTGAVTGGLAGFYYGFEAIPKEWVEVLPKLDGIETICNRLG